MKKKKWTEKKNQTTCQRSVNESNYLFQVFSETVVIWTELPYYYSSCLVSIQIWVCKPFNSQIKFVILFSVNHTILIMLVTENLVLNQLIIPKLIFFLILITYVVDIVLIL